MCYCRSYLAIIASIFYTTYGVVNAVLGIFLLLIYDCRFILGGVDDNDEDVTTIFISQYLKGPQCSSTPASKWYKCKYSSVIELTYDPAHTFTDSSSTYIWLITFVSLNTLWILSSQLSLAESCSRKDKSVKFCGLMLGVTTIILIFNIVAGVCYSLDLVYVIGLSDCMDVDSNLFIGLLGGALTFPVYFIGGFLFWLISLILLICIFNSRYYKHASLEPEERRDDNSWINAFELPNKNNEEMSYTDTEPQRPRSCIDLKERRYAPSIKEEQDASVQVDFPTSNVRPDIRADLRRRMSTSTQTALDVGTQTLDFRVSSSPRRPSQNESEKIVLTPSKKGRVSPSSPTSGNPFQYPPRPPPLPLPNLNESSPDQPWSLILRKQRDQEDMN